MQCDSTFAKQLFSSLFQAVFSQIEEKLPEREGVSVTLDVNKAINDLMSSSTQFFPPFISSVQVSTFFERKKVLFLFWVISHKYTAVLFNVPITLLDLHCIKM